MENQDRARERPQEHSSERPDRTREAADHLLRSALSLLNRPDSSDGKGEESRAEALDQVRQALACLGYESGLRPIGSTEPFAPPPPAPDDEPIPPGKEHFHRLLRDRGMTHQRALHHIATIS